MWDNQRYFVSSMLGAGFDLPATTTPIVPLVVGDEHECTRVARGLRDAGFHVDPIMFPAVGSGRPAAFHHECASHGRDIDRLVGALSESVRPATRA